MTRPGRIGLALLMLAGTTAEAKPPSLRNLFPPGAARGQKVHVEAAGDFERWPVEAWVDGGGVAVEVLPEKGRLAITVAPDAEPGLHRIRLHDAEGATTLRPFVVGTIPEVEEAEPNQELAAPQRLDGLPVTVNGRLLKRGDVDAFALKLDRGRTLVADIDANKRLGSPMDALLQVVSADGFVLAQNDDDVARDPRLVFESPADGTYLVRVFAFPFVQSSEIRFAGGNDFNYRLTLTAGGFLDHPFPLALARDSADPVEANGPNLDAGDRALPVPPADDREIQTLSRPDLAGTAELQRVDHPTGVEAEPCDLEHPQPIAPPIAISGRIDPASDVDAFGFPLKKGEKRVVRVESRALGLPLDPTLQILDADGKVVGEADDAGKDRDAELTFAAPADGDFRAVVRDLNGRGSPRHAYLLSVLAPESDFAIALKADRIEVEPGKATPLVVAVERRGGFAGTIEVAAEGLSSGVSAAPATSKADDASAKAVTLQISADPTARSGPFRVVGRSNGNPARPRPALAPVEGSDVKTDRPWLTIRPAPSNPANPAK